MRNLRRGDRSTAVTELQGLLNEKGASPSLTTDGVFGAKTDTAVRTFQRSAGLSVDGIVGPNTRTALEGAKKAPKKVAPRPARGGQSVTLTHAAKYKGKTLGAAPYQGECAAGVQQVFAEAKKSLGLTRTWKAGKLVKGGNVAPGTAIASFKDGKYWKHTAILIRETNAGLEVWDQWHNQPWHKRTLRFINGDTANGSNNGNLFYVVSK